MLREVAILLGKSIRPPKGLRWRQVVQIESQPNCLSGRGKSPTPKRIRASHSRSRISCVSAARDSARTSACCPGPCRASAIASILRKSRGNRPPGNDDTCSASIERRLQIVARIECRIRGQADRLGGIERHEFVSKPLGNNLPFVHVGKKSAAPINRTEGGFARGGGETRQ